MYWLEQVMFNIAKRVGVLSKLQHEYKPTYVEWAKLDYLKQEQIEQYRKLLEVQNGTRERD